MKLYLTQLATACLALLSSVQSLLLVTSNEKVVADPNYQDRLRVIDGPCGLMEMYSTCTYAFARYHQRNLFSYRRRVNEYPYSLNGTNDTLKIFINSVSDHGGILTSYGYSWDFDLTTEPYRYMYKELLKYRESLTDDQAKGLELIHREHEVRIKQGISLDLFASLLRRPEFSVFEERGILINSKNLPNAVDRFCDRYLVVNADSFSNLAPFIREFYNLGRRDNKKLRHQIYKADGYAVLYIEGGKIQTMVAGTNIELPENATSYAPTFDKDAYRGTFTMDAERRAAYEEQLPPRKDITFGNASNPNLPVRYL